ncbi:MAG: FeS-binding protein [Deltaproteobacteria bacterium]|nr:FeS-binding protein [Deltaproteobacteria bacterium]
MTYSPSEIPVRQNGLFKKFYVFVLFVLVFTGFGQMPIFKRYYLADIPGLGWTANFFATHYIHHIAAIFILGVLAYGTARFLLSGRNRSRLTVPAYMRIIILAGLLFSGIMMAARNMTSVTLSPAFSMAMNFMHLGLTMIFLIASLVFVIFKKGWLVENTLN